MMYHQLIFENEEGDSEAVPQLPSAQESPLACPRAPQGVVSAAHQVVQSILIEL